MPDERVAYNYSPGQLEQVRATCLSVATVLGDLLQEVVVVGGLVPSLIVDQTKLATGAEPHRGTQDLDLGLNVTLLDQERYRAVSKRLREGRFSPDVNQQGNLTRQRWCVRSGGSKVTIDFLIPPSRQGDQAGTLRDLEADFAAFIISGLRLAFLDRQTIQLRGRTFFDEEAVRNVEVCGPGAFVVLKALAFEARGYRKDAYDLYYVVRNYGGGVEDVAARLRGLLKEPEATRALQVLERDFLDPNGLGAMRAAQFFSGNVEEDVRADVVGFIRRLVGMCARSPSSHA
jgi:hypothetical protein